MGPRTVTNAGTGWFSLNHDVYGDSPTIVADMRQIMKAGVRPPDRRTKEFEAILGKEGSTYWRLRLPVPSQMKVWWGSYAASARDRFMALFDRWDWATVMSGYKVTFTVAKTLERTEKVDPPRNSPSRWSNTPAPHVEN